MITTAGMPPYTNHGKPVELSAIKPSSIKPANPANMQQSVSQDWDHSSSSSLDQAQNLQHPDNRAPLRPVSSQSSGHTPVGMNGSNPSVTGNWNMTAANTLHVPGFAPVFATQDGKIAANSAKGSKKAKVAAPAKKRQATKAGAVAEKRKGNTVTARRQKRLERNRESARLSRRRRKQYLEVLEDRVTQLSIEMDQGRREHAAKAIETILEKRRQIIWNNPVSDSLSKLDVALSRTSSELSVLSTFYMQQLKSFSLPAHSKFVLWLTLQGDTYFRGGRAASERLSAARIGERMLMSGNDKVPPAGSMWPLVCNEVGLSYDQEERVRNFQRNLLQTPETWLERHSAKASRLVMQSFHDGLNTVAQGIRQRERSTLKGLTADQRLKFAMWAEQNADRIKAKIQARRQEAAKAKEGEKYKLSNSHHVAANLYILTDRLQKVISSFPKTLNDVSPAALKRLSRRPSFESLGQQKEEGTPGLTREGSFASSGSLKSLKKSSSSQSMEDEDQPHPQQVSPEDGQKDAAATIEKALGFVKPIIPPTAPPTLPPQPVTAALPATPPRAYNAYSSQQAPKPEAAVSTSQFQQQPSAQYTISRHPGAQPMSEQGHPYPPFSHNQQGQQYYYPHPPTHENTNASSTAYQTQQAKQQGAGHHQPHQQPNSRDQQRQAGKTHVRRSSFLPAHLNVVPEEMFPSGDGAAEDFFMSLIDDEDWAIGEGIEMDSTT